MHLTLSDPYIGMIETVIHARDTRLGEPDLRYWNTRTASLLTCRIGRVMGECPGADY